MDVITTTKALEALCGELRNDDFITVDTEFMRESTFWPVLCLIQIASTSREAVVDPLSKGLDLKPFYDLMGDETVLKVFHAARQDIEIVYTQGGIIPHPLFDTQVAAMVCGFGDQIGYEAIVRKLAGGNIDKSSRFTDWSRRPLSDKQLAYALSDVTFLREVYRRLRAELNRSHRESWLEEEMAVLTAPSTYESHPEDAWKRIKYRARNKRQVAVLMEVAAWREAEAQARNVPRNRVLKDDALTEIATQAPRSAGDLDRLRAVPRGFSGSRHAAGLLRAVEAGLARDQAGIPDIRQHRAVPEGAGAVAEVLKLALKVISENEGIAPKLIANSSDIDAIAAGKRKGVAQFKGWRQKVFGAVAQRLMNGELAIGLRDGKAEIFAVTADDESSQAAE